MEEETEVSESENRMCKMGAAWENVLPVFKFLLQVLCKVELFSSWVQLFYFFMSTQLIDSVINDRTYDERAGCYIRFPSETDAIIASLALSQNCLSWQDLDRILRVVANPKFDPTKITLHSAAEILQHAERSRVDEYAKKAHTRNKSNARAAVSRRQPLPLVILDEVLEIFHRERKLALEPERTYSYYGAVYQLNDVEKGHTFSIMSLVHRSWTLPCQHALGRIVRITDVDKFISKDRLMSSIHGPWTTSMIINAQTGSNGRLRPINTQDLEKFFLRFSNIRSLWIKVGNDWSSVWWLNDFYGEILKRNHRLQVLRLHGGKGVVPKVSLQPYFDNREHLEELHTLDVHDFSDGDVEMVPHPPPQKSPLRHFTFFASGGMDNVRLASILPSNPDGEGLQTFTLLDEGGRVATLYPSFDAKRFAKTWKTLNRLVLRTQEYYLPQWAASLLPHCSNLRVLSFNDLMQLPASYGVSYKTLPRSLTKIEFNFNDPGSAQFFLGLPDLLEFLATQSLTGLKLLFFSFAPLTSYGDHLPESRAEKRRKQKKEIRKALIELSLFCEENFITFRWIIRE